MRRLLGVYNCGSSSVEPSRIPIIPPKQPGSTRFVCLSDTHIKHDELTSFLPSGDVLIHTGDFSYTGLQFEVEGFAKWIGELPYKHKIVIAGNHDLPFQPDYYDTNWQRFHSNYDKQNAEIIKSTLQKNCTYLEDEEVTVLGFRIYGSPWQPTFGNWAFNLDRGAPIRQKWDLIPKDIDILLTHGPLKGYGGMTACGEDAGCADLCDIIDNVVKPNVHIFGYIHEDYGVFQGAQTVFINASNCTKKYKPTNLPIVFDME